MHVEFDKYANRNSFIHAWDNRVKIFSLFIYIICISLSKKIPVLTGVLVLNFFLALTSRLPLAYIMNKLKSPSYFFIFVLVVLPLWGSGQKYRVFNNFYVYKQGLNFAVIIILRGYSIVVAGILIFATSPFDKTMRAMRNMKIPDVIVMIILFTHRYINMYKNNAAKMKMALRLRGGVKPYTKKLFVSYSSFIVSLLVRSYEQTIRIYYAMILRGYESNEYLHFPFKSGIKDYIKAGVFLLMGAGILLPEYLL